MSGDLEPVMQRRSPPDREGGAEREGLLGADGPRDAVVLRAVTPLRALDGVRLDDRRLGVAAHGAHISAPGELSVQRLLSAGEVLDLRDGWERLLAQALPGSPFLTPEWCLAFWRVYSAGGEGMEDARLWVLVVRRGGQVVGVLPLYRTTEQVGPVPVRKLRLCATGPMHVPSGLDLIARPADAPAVGRTLARYLREHGRDWDVLDLWSVRRESPGVAALLEALSPGALRISDTHAHHSRYVTLPATWAEYQQCLSPGYRKKLERYERRLQKEVPYRLVVCLAESLEAELDELVRIRLESWQQTTTHAFEDPRFIRFHRQLMPALQRRGWLRLVMLQSQAGQRLAYGYLIVRNREATFYQQARLHTLEKLHLGSVLIAHLLRLSISEGVRRFDFGPDAPYKAHFAPQLCEDRRLRVYAPGVRGRIQLLRDELSVLAQSRMVKDAPRTGG